MPRTPDEIMRQRWNDIQNTKKWNYNEVTKFFYGLYKAETDPICPVKLSEIFTDITIPDIRTPEQKLEKLWPHYFGLPEITDASIRDYLPPSELYTKEKDNLLNLLRAIRKRVDQINEETMRICEQHSAVRN